MEKLKGEHGWAGLAAFVIAWDIFAPETLSSACDRGLENRLAKPFVIGGIALTAAHLLNVLPETVDPFQFICKLRPHKKAWKFSWFLGFKITKPLAA